jgi:hypothetical protein
VFQVGCRKTSQEVAGRCRLASHLGLLKETPQGRLIQGPELGQVVAVRGGRSSPSLRAVSRMTSARASFREGQVLSEGGVMVGWVFAHYGVVITPVSAACRRKAQ